MLLKIAISCDFLFENRHARGTDRRFDIPDIQNRHTVIYNSTCHTSSYSKRPRWLFPFKGTALVKSVLSFALPLNGTELVWQQLERCFFGVRLCCQGAPFFVQEVKRMSAFEFKPD